MTSRKTLLERFIKGIKYSRDIRHACPQQFAVVGGFLNTQSLLRLKVKGSQGHLLHSIFTRNISEVECRQHVLEKTVGKTQIVNRPRPCLWIMQNRDNIPGKCPNQLHVAAANVLLYKYLLGQRKKHGQNSLVVRADANLRIKSNSSQSLVSDIFSFSIQN